MTKNDRFDFEERIVPRALVSEMEESFLDYAMSVIVSRAIPDARDGLKPIHRRILWAMHENGYSSDKPTSKCAGIIGDVLKYYHPHGDGAVYDALVRMAQEWSLRYILVHPQGSFGSVDGDSPAAYRYTEARLRPLAEYLLEDVNKETVDWIPNFDGKKEEPTVLPAGLPNLLMNGSEGIAVGMATRIPPHNLRELTAAVLHLIEHPDCPVEELIGFVPGPDFPTGGIMLGNSGAVEAYTHGRGTVTVRGRAEIDLDDKGRPRIIISDLPYQVNKASLVERIAILSHNKKIEHIRDVRDESNKEGQRVVVELGAQAQPQVVLNNLYKQTQLQTSYSMIMLALRDGTPRVMNLKELLVVFVGHRREVVRRRSEFDKRKAEERAHVLEGLKIALDNLDEVVKLIRASRDPAAAKAGLVERFGLTEIQAQAILEMRLSQLTNLEAGKILDELNALYARIKELEAILADGGMLDGVVVRELKEGSAKYGDERRTVIARFTDDGSFDEDELIRKEDVVVTLSRGGYMKRTPASVYEAQHRGGRGKIGQKTAAEDVVRNVIHTNTHDTLLCFTSRGIVHRLRVYKVPAYDRNAKGLPVVNMLNLQPGETISALIPLANFDDANLFFCTSLGTVKRTLLSEFSQLRVTGKRAISLDDADSLAFVVPTTGKDQMIIITREGMAVKFDEEQVRVMGTTAAGVRGVKLGGADDRVVGLDVAAEDEDLLVVGENGYGKRSRVELFRKTNRGAKGVIAMKASAKTGLLMSAVKVTDADELLILTKEGMIIRMEIGGISQLGRATQGVRLINLREGDKVASVEVIRGGGDPGLFGGGAPATPESGE